MATKPRMFIRRIFDGMPKYEEITRRQNERMARAKGETGEKRVTGQKNFNSETVNALRNMQLAVHRSAIYFH